MTNMLLKDILAKAGSPVDTNIEKNTAEDKRRVISDSLSSAFNINGERAYSYLYDYDESFVYFEVYDPSYGGYKYWKAGYSYNGTSATFATGEATEVVKLTQWIDVVNDVEKSLVDKFTSAVSKIIDKNFLNLQKSNGLPVIKQFDVEQMISIEPLYIQIDGEDGVGDSYYDSDTCYGMVDSLNKAIDSKTIQANYFHKVMTEDFSIIKAWVNECDCMIGDTLVPEGLPIVKLQFNDENAWELRKSGDLMGVSIGAQAKEIIEIES